MNPLRLLPPIVTATATFVGELGGAIAGIPLTAHHVFGFADPWATLFGDVIAGKIEAVGVIAAAICVPIAGAGRSFVKSVDNPQPPATK